MMLVKMLSATTLMISTISPSERPAERAASGVSDDLVRLSLGLEDPADLVADLDKALGSSS